MNVFAEDTTHLILILIFWWNAYLERRVPRPVALIVIRIQRHVSQFQSFQARFIENQSDVPLTIYRSRSKMWGKYATRVIVSLLQSSKSESLSYFGFVPAKNARVTTARVALD